MGYKKKYDFKNRSWEDVQEELADDDVHAEMYKESNFMVRGLFNKRFDLIYDFIKDKKNIKLLDVGCGDGFFLEKIKNLGFDVYGTDISKKRLKRAAKKMVGVKLFNYKAEDMPFKNNFFDIIICTDVLEHVEDPSKVINEMKRLAKNGGFVIVSFPNESLWTFCRALLLRFPIKIPDHLNSFSIKSMDSGFKTVKVFEKHLPFRFFSLSRIVGYKIKK